MAPETLLWSEGNQGCKAPKPFSGKFLVLLYSMFSHRLEFLLFLPPLPRVGATGTHSPTTLGLENSLNPVQIISLWDQAGFVTILMS